MFCWHFDCKQCTHTHAIVSRIADTQLWCVWARNLRNFHWMNGVESWKTASKSVSVSCKWVGHCECKTLRQNNIASKRKNSREKWTSFFLFLSPRVWKKPLTLQKEIGNWLRNIVVENVCLMLNRERKRKEHYRRWCSLHNIIDCNRRIFFQLIFYQMSEWH